jgi:hypothetical protein
VVGVGLAVWLAVGLAVALADALAEALAEALADALAEALALALAEALALALAEALALTSLQSVAVIVLVSKVTSPFRARARPAIFAPFLRWISVRAMMVPTNVVVVSRVAELLTCQKTLQGSAPLMRATVAPGAVTRVLPVLKM